MTTVNSRLVNLRRPASDVAYTLAQFVSDCPVVPYEVFETLDDATLFLREHREGAVAFPRKTDVNPSKHTAFLRAVSDSLGVVTLNLTTSSDHCPLSEDDKRPVLGSEWLRGDVVMNVNGANLYAPTSWVCVEAGLPGRWLAQGYTTRGYSDVQVVDELPGASEATEGRLVLHRVTAQQSELCYCAKIGDNAYEWKNVLGYSVDAEPDEEDLWFKFLSYNFPLARMDEFEKASGPSLSAVYDLRDRYITAEDLVEYDRTSTNKVPTYSDDSTYLTDNVIEPTDDLDEIVTGTWYCPYDFSTYDEDTKPNGYPPIDHPAILRVGQYKRIADGVPGIAVLQKATDVLTGETYSRCGSLEDGKMTRNLPGLDKESLYDWHENGNAEPIADLADLIALLDNTTPTG